MEKGRGKRGERGPDMEIGGWIVGKGKKKSLLWASSAWLFVVGTGGRFVCWVWYGDEWDYWMGGAVLWLGLGVSEGTRRAECCD